MKELYARTSKNREREEKVDVNNICSLIRYFIENDSVTGQIMNVDSGQSLAWKTPDILKSKE